MSPIRYEFDDGQKGEIGAAGGAVSRPDGVSLSYNGDSLGTGYLAGPRIKGERDLDRFSVGIIFDKTANLSVVKKVVPPIEVGGEETKIRIRAKVERY